MMDSKAVNAETLVVARGASIHSISRFICLAVQFLTVCNNNLGIRLMVSGIPALPSEQSRIDTTKPQEPEKSITRGASTRSTLPLALGFYSDL